MKITITTDRQPWADDRPRAKGETVDLSDAEAAALIANGFAVAVDSPPTVAPVPVDAVPADDVPEPAPAPRRRRTAVEGEAV